MADITYHADPNVISYIGEKVRKETYYLGQGPEIPAGADLNEYTTPGVYITRSDGVTTSLQNVPDQLSGNSSLIVRKVINDATLQNIKSNTNHIGASRLLDTNTNTWGDWRYDSGTDAIIAQGSTAGWRWVKYADGMAQCWRQTNIAAGAKYTNWGTALKYVTIPPSSYPFTFTRFWLFSSSTDGNHWPVSYEGGATQPGNIYMATPLTTQTSVTTQLVTVNLLVVGFWK